MCLLCLVTFKIFLFIFHFYQFDSDMWFSLYWSCLGLVVIFFISDLIFFHSIWEVFSQYLFKYVFFIFLLSPYESLIIHVRLLDVFLQVIETLFLFFPVVFSLFLKLDNFYWSPFNFTNPFAFGFHSAVNSIKWIFHI